MRKVFSGFFAALATLQLTGCVLSPVDLTERPCPCAPGWSCVEGVCVPAGADAGPRLDASSPPQDGGTDGGELDAGALDGGAPDAGAPDAGAPDAGAPDAGAPDAGAPDAGPTRCDDLHAGALFCDGFEWVYPGGRVGWQGEERDMGTLDTVTSPRPYIGARALRASTTGLGGTAGLTTSLPEAAGISSGQFWLRAFVRIPSGLTITEGNVFGLLYFTSVDDRLGTAVALEEGGKVAVTLWDTHALAGWHSSGRALPRDVWTCVQLHVTLEAFGGAVELFLDEERILSVSDVPIDVDGSSMRWLYAGLLFSTDEQGPSMVYLDEVVLSRSFIPCE